MIHHPIVGEAEHVAEAVAEALAIPTAVCPVCGAGRRSVTQYHKALRDGSRPFLITWTCGSYALLSSPPCLRVSAKCSSCRFEVV